MNQQAAAHPEESAANPYRKFWKKYRKPIVITLGITVLNIVFGFDARFTLINLLWLLV